MEQMAEDVAETEVGQVAEGTTEEAQEMELEMELDKNDLLNIDVTNNQTSSGKDTDSSSTKRTYMRLHQLYQDFVSNVNSHPTQAGLDCMDAHLPNQANNYGVVPDGRERCSV
jgi:hypothetical protein